MKFPFYVYKSEPLTNIYIPIFNQINTTFWIGIIFKQRNLLKFGTKLIAIFIIILLEKWEFKFELFIYLVGL